MHWPRQLYSNGGYTGQGDFTGTVDHWLRGLHSNGGYTGQGDFTGTVDHWLRGLHSDGVGVTPPLSLHRAAVPWEEEQKLHYHLYFV